MRQNIRLQRPDNYLADESKKLQQLDLPTVQQDAQILKPDNAVWLVVGDKEKILPQLKALGWGDVMELSKDGDSLN